MTQEKKFYLTKKGLEEIKKEYEVLKALRAAKTKGEVPKILESEDLNPDYLSFREDLNLLERRMFELEHVLKHAELIKKPQKGEENIVCLGATILVDVEGHKDEFSLVGTLEASPVLGKISNESPVGRALLGRRIGDKVEISSPVKTIYKIEKISYKLL